MMEMIIAALAVTTVSLLCYSYGASREIERLRTELAKQFYYDLLRKRSRRVVKILNPQLGDQSVLDAKVERLMKEGYYLYKDGCQSGMLAFAKDEEVEEKKEE